MFDIFKDKERSFDLYSIIISNLFSVDLTITFTK